MTERQKSIVKIYEANPYKDEPVLSAIYDFAGLIAEECLVSELYINGELVYRT